MSYPLNPLHLPAAVIVEHPNLPPRFLHSATPFPGLLWSLIGDKIFFLYGVFTSRQGRDVTFGPLHIVNLVPGSSHFLPRERRPWERGCAHCVKNCQPRS